MTVGLLGAFTTMSTFSLEYFKLLEEQQNMLFITNLTLNNLLSLAGIYLGKIASALLWGRGVPISQPVIGFFH